MFRRTFSAFTVVAAIAGSAFLPGTALAKDHGRHVGRKRVHHDNGLHLGQTRWFDREHRDYHRWNRGEDARYRQFLAERRRPFVGFRRAGRPLQLEYWQWRHDHR